MRVIDTYGWIEYFSDGELAKKYAAYVETADDRKGTQEGLKISLD